MKRDPVDGARAERMQRTGRIALLGAVGAAFAASLCCIGPILFVTVGVGAGLGSSFEPLRPLLTVLALAALGTGFYAVYGRRAQPAECAPGGSCAIPARRRRDQVILWAATVLTAVLWSFNYWSTLLL